MGYNLKGCGKPAALSKLSSKWIASISRINKFPPNEIFISMAALKVEHIFSTSPYWFGIMIWIIVDRMQAMLKNIVEALSFSCLHPPSRCKCEQKKRCKMNEDCRSIVGKNTTKKLHKCLNRINKINTESVDGFAKCRNIEKKNIHGTFKYVRFYLAISWSGN